MIYPDDIEQRIGFDRIRSMTEQRLHTSAAQSLLEAAQFSCSQEDVVRRLKLVAEMRGVLLGGDDFPTSGYLDTTPLLKRLSVEGTHLDLEEMGDLRVAFT
ncbi:MAG: endonuclease MutS2, partial [Rikenellaceae bacterium]|nr:endonuclease MutS2 [Rikenellaceae bacterium]